MGRFAVVSLNWKAAADTVACLDSVLAGDSRALPVVVDNGSDDDSVAQIMAWAARRSIEVMVCYDEAMDGLMEGAPHAQLVLVKSRENLGFAKGCNLGLKAVRYLRIDEIVFLNNDTVVAVGALSRLVDRLRADPQVFATLPMILVHESRTIWNCGGKISRLGYRRYHLAGAQLDQTAVPAEIECTFFTGCCFAVRTAQFASRGGFSERFFFGEEDFELCLWMRDHAKRAIALTDSVVEHRVSATFTRASRSEAAKVYVYYLNRFIHMRLRLGRMVWLLWLVGYLPYAAYLLLRTSVVESKELPRFVWRLLTDAVQHNGVDRTLFMKIMRTSRW